MSRLTVTALSVLLLCASQLATAQRVTLQGRAIVEYSSPRIKAVAAYEYSQRNHKGTWILIELAVQAKERIAIERDQISIITPDERKIALATQDQFLEDHEVLNQLLQNAKIWRRPLISYFTVRPEPTIRFFSYPGRIVHNSFATNLDQVAEGDLFFKADQWPSGMYQLTINHPQAVAELPIELE